MLPSGKRRADRGRSVKIRQARVADRGARQQGGHHAHGAQVTLASTFAVGDEPAKTVRVRMMGGGLPTDKLVEALDVPFVIIPHGDNNQHSFDENIRLGHYLAGIRTFTGLLRAPY
jgi:acetylornithine deacetylase/succinyl-diaminopimelate desuccinylase-like protein